jgi:parallel beta-helix repeat protein
MRYLIIIFYVSIIAFSFHHAQAKIIHVPDDSSTIQAGINGAAAGDTVLIDPGIYYENVKAAGKNIVLASQYIINEDTSLISSTIINGSAIDYVIAIQHSAGKIKGLTITNGFTGSGGGIGIYKCPTPSDDSLVIAYNRIVDNLACGIFTAESKANITNNILMNNYDDYAGGGIYCYGVDSSTIVGNLFVGNSTAQAGGAISCQGGACPTIRNNTISGNSATLNRGGGIHYGTESYPQIINNIIVFNSAGGIRSDSPADSLFYNDVWGNLDGGDYIGCDPGTGDISCDPEFCDTMKDNYHLFSSSCCVGTGQGGVDIGAFGVGCLPIPPDPFSLLFPPNKAFTPRGVHFDWETATDPDPSDHVRYDLYVSTSYQFPPGQTTIDSDLPSSDHTKILDYGTYYWKVKAKDSHGAERWSNQIRYFMVTGIHYSGDLNGDGSIDVGDVALLLNYLYNSGPAPDPLESGDGNCDEVVNGADLVYFINYLFIGGPPPGC